MPTLRSHPGSSESNRPEAGPQREESGRELPEAERRGDAENRVIAGTVIPETRPATSRSGEPGEHSGGWWPKWQQQQQQIEQALTTIEERLDQLAGGGASASPGPRLSVVGLTGEPACSREEAGH